MNRFLLILGILTLLAGGCATNRDVSRETDRGIAQHNEDTEAHEKKPRNWLLWGSGGTAGVGALGALAAWLKKQREGGGE